MSISTGVMPGPVGQLGGVARHAQRISGMRIAGSGIRAEAAARARDVRWDRWTLIAALVAFVAGLIAVVVSYSNNWLLNYTDAVHHMNIARRVLDNRTPGLAQLGTVWLPLPHLLMLPFVANDFLWSTGLAGSMVGLPCFVISAVMIFQAVRLVVRYQFAAWIALLVFVSNPNALYTQATALTEPVLLMSLASSAYFFLRWSLLDNTDDLISASLLAVLAVESRYDGWFFAVTCGAIVVIITLLRWRDPDRAEGLTLAYLAPPVCAMFLWLFYNGIIFGDPLAFARGQYSAGFQQSQIAASGLLPTKHHIILSAATYGGAMLLNLGSVILAFAVAGLIVYAVVHRLQAESLGAYAYVSVLGFNVLALYLGQSIISTPLTNPPGYFNVRYGLVILPAAAFFIGFLADYLARRSRPALIGVVFAGILALQGALWVPNWPASVVTVAEGLDHATSSLQSVPAADWLKDHYHGGGILYDDSHSVLILKAGINMSEYFLSGPLQTKVLKDPVRYAEWVVLAPYSPGDAVNVALRGTTYLTQHYALVFSGGSYQIYRRDRPVQPAP